MTKREFHLAFKVKLDKEDILGYLSFTPEEVDFWLQQSVIQFVKTRYSGHDDLMDDGFQSTEKRNNDLRNTLNIISVKPIKKSENIYEVELPNDFWMSVGEDVYITSDDPRWPKNPSKYCNIECNKNCNHCARSIPTVIKVDPLDTTLLDNTSKYNDVLSEMNLNANNARPLRLSHNNVIEYETDGNYLIDNVKITYIKSPEKFSQIKPDEEYTYIPEHAHDEIVNGAIQFAMADLSDPRLSNYVSLNKNQE